MADADKSAAFARRTAAAAAERIHLFEPPRRFCAHSLDRFMQLCARRLRGANQRLQFSEPPNQYEHAYDMLLRSGFELRAFATVDEVIQHTQKWLRCFACPADARYRFETVANPCDNDVHDGALEHYRHVFLNATLVVIGFELFALNWQLLVSTDRTRTLRGTIAKKYTDITTAWCNGYWVGGAHFAERYRFMAGDNAVLLPPPTKIVLCV